MSPLRARVEKGRLVLDEPTTLREGTVIELVADDEGDDLTEEERQALHEALSASWESAEAGRLRPASEILDELRQSGVEESELNKAKEQLKSGYMLSLESTNNRMSRLGKNELLLGKHVTLDETIECIERVTTEDILGELVGKFRGNVTSKGFVMEKLGPGRWRVNGTMRLDDFRREYPALAGAAEVETMGGLLTGLLGVVPATGESAMVSGLRLKALVVDERRVHELEAEVVK